MRLQGRVAMVTGAGRGLGAVYAHALAREGATIVVIDLNAQGGEETARAIREAGGQCMAYIGDLTDPIQIEHIMDDCIAAHGRLDILVNNAGGDPPGGSGAIEEANLAHWDRVFAMNLRTTLLCCQQAAGQMKRQRSGKIVNISSRAARGTGWYSGLTPEYVCAKLGVIALTRHVAKELGPYGINVNCMVPSFTISGPYLQGVWDSMSQAEQETMLAQTPLRRLPRPEELANVVVFLSSDESSYITGAAIDVNGGSFMG